MDVRWCSFSAMIIVVSMMPIIATVITIIKCKGGITTPVIIIEWIIEKRIVIIWTSPTEGY